MVWLQRNIVASFFKSTMFLKTKVNLQSATHKKIESHNRPRKKVQICVEFVSVGERGLAWHI